MKLLLVIYLLINRLCLGIVAVSKSRTNYFLNYFFKRECDKLDNVKDLKYFLDSKIIYHV